MQFLVILVLLAQTLTIPGYVVPSDTRANGLDLWLDIGRMSIDSGAGCDTLQPFTNVQFLAGSGDVGVLSTTEFDRCNIVITDLVSTDSCAQIDGACDITAYIPSPKENP